MQIFTNSNYDFIKWRWHAVALSVIFIAVGIGIGLTRGVNLSIDFAGGASITLKFKDAVPMPTLRAAMPEATIQQYGRAQDRSVLIRLPNQGTEGDYAGRTVESLHTKLNPEAATKLDLNYRGTDQLAALLQETDPDVRGTNPAAIQHYRDLAERIIEKRSTLGLFTDPQQVTSVDGVSTGVAKVLNERTILGQFNVLNQETVGPAVGKELQGKAFWAIVLSSLAIFAYIWLRFDLAFGAAAVACIIHDVLVATAFMLMMNLEFSLNVVAAILTIVGYSINDNVVTYDRVRENKRKVKTPMSLAQHLNWAMNQTLSRTVLTAGSVFLVLLAMLVFGGDVIRGFSWILLVGVVSGTYSTLLIVPAVAVSWDRMRASKAPAARPVPREEPTAPKRRAS